MAPGVVFHFTFSAFVRKIGITVVTVVFFIDTFGLLFFLIPCFAESLLVYIFLFDVKIKKCT